MLLPGATLTREQEGRKQHDCSKPRKCSRRAPRKKSGKDVSKRNSVESLIKGKRSNRKGGPVNMAMWPSFIKTGAWKPRHRETYADGKNKRPEKIIHGNREMLVDGSERRVSKAKVHHLRLRASTDRKKRREERASFAQANHIDYRVGKAKISRLNTSG